MLEQQRAHSANDIEAFASGVSESVTEGLHQRSVPQFSKPTKKRNKYDNTDKSFRTVKTKTERENTRYGWSFVINLICFIGFATYWCYENRNNMKGIYHHCSSGFTGVNFSMFNCMIIFSNNCLVSFTDHLKIQKNARKVHVYIHEIFWSFIAFMILIIPAWDGLMNMFDGKCTLDMYHPAFCWQNYTALWGVTTSTAMIASLYFFELVYLGDQMRKSLFIHHLLTIIVHVYSFSESHYDSFLHKAYGLPLLALMEQLVFVALLNNIFKFTGKWIYIAAIVQFVLFKILFVVFLYFVFGYNWDNKTTLDKVIYYFILTSLLFVQHPTVMAMWYLYKKQ